MSVTQWNSSLHHRTSNFFFSSPSVSVVIVAAEKRTAPVFVHYGFLTHRAFKTPPWRTALYLRRSHKACNKWFIIIFEVGSKLTVESYLEASLGYMAFAGCYIIWLKLRAHWGIASSSFCYPTHTVDFPVPNCCNAKRPMQSQDSWCQQLQGIEICQELSSKSTFATSCPQGGVVVARGSVKSNATP